MKTSKIDSLSVFFPVYNEQKNIPIFIKEAQEFIPQVAKKYELIIVNDGSHDKSQEVAEQLAKQDSHIKVVNHHKNKGYGAALKSGIKHSQYKWIFFTDGDLQFKIKQLKKFIKYTDKYDVILGYRTKRYEGSVRLLNQRMWKLYIDLLYRVHVKDIDCAFKLFKASVIKPLDLISDGAFLSSEILYKLKKRQVKFKQLPVTHQPRRYGTPTGANPKVIFKAVKDSFLLYLKIKFGKKKSEH